MDIRRIIPVMVLLFGFTSICNAQSDTTRHISRLEIKKGKKEVFTNKSRDSVLVLTVDTLILKDRASLQFYGLKDVKLNVNYAEIGNKAFIIGRGAQNNASNFDIDILLNKLGSLYIAARGQDAMNGTRTFPNGDGGKVKFRYDKNGIAPQSEDKKAKNYLHIDVSEGGRAVNPQSEIGMIMSRINSGQPRMGGVPQGQVYSGSPGNAGTVSIEAK